MRRAPVGDTPGIWRPCTGLRGKKADQKAQAESPDPAVREHLLYAFLTTEPNAVVKPIHSKAMQVMVTRDQWMPWLTAPTEIAKVMVRPFPANEMAEPTDS